jgi:hypothetical protein
MQVRQPRCGPCVDRITSTHHHHASSGAQHDELRFGNESRVLAALTLSARQSVCKVLRNVSERCELKQKRPLLLPSRVNAHDSFSLASSKSQFTFVIKCHLLKFKLTFVPATATGLFAAISFARATARAFHLECHERVAVIRSVAGGGVTPGGQKEIRGR